MKTRISRFIVYVAGFSICLGSYALLVHFRGNRGSNLGWAVVSLSELVRHTFGLGWERPGGVFNFSTLLACAILALVFLSVFLLMTATSKYLRIPGYVLLAGLVYLTLYWFRTPLNLF